MAFMAAALPVISTVMGAAGAVYTGFAQKQAADYQAQVARNNALAAEQMKRVEIQNGLIAAQEQDRANAEKAGMQRAAMAASGFDINEGTQREIGVSQTILGRTDSLRKAHAGQLAGWNLQNRADNFRAEASLAESRGNNAMMSGIFGGATSLIGGATKFSDKWNMYSSPAPTQLRLGTPSVYGTLY